MAVHQLVQQLPQHRLRQRSEHVELRLETPPNELHHFLLFTRTVLWVGVGLWMVELRQAIPRVHEVEVAVL